MFTLQTSQRTIIQYMLTVSTWIMYLIHIYILNYFTILILNAELADDMPPIFITFG